MLTNLIFYDSDSTGFSFFSEDKECIFRSLDIYELGNR
ncbi:hypothetical protein [Candidatus Pristimantibacillus sp. PTI5]